MKPKTDCKWRRDKWGWRNRHLPGVTSRVRRVGGRIIVSVAAVDANGIITDSVYSDLERVTLAEAKVIAEAIEPVVLKRTKGTK